MGYMLSGGNTQDCLQENSMESACAVLLRSSTSSIKLQKSSYQVLSNVEAVIDMNKYSFIVTYIYYELKEWAERISFEQLRRKL